MRRLLVAMLLLAAACGPQKWHHHVSTDGVASVDFPDEPDPEEAKARGGGTRTRWVYDTSNESYLFSTSVDEADIPMSRRMNAIEAELGNDGYRVIRRERNSCGQMICSDLDLRNDQRKTILTVRMAASRGTVYRIVGETLGRETHHPDVRRFLSSFDVKR